MNTRSAAGRRHDTLGSLFDAAESTFGATPEELAAPHPAEGDWFVDEEASQVLIVVPGAGVCAFPYAETNAVGARWAYDGNADAPTLTPSLLAIGKWHGWMRSGQLLSC